MPALPGPRRHPWRQAEPKPGPLPARMPALPGLCHPWRQASHSQARCRQGCRRSQGFAIPGGRLRQSQAPAPARMPGAPCRARSPSLAAGCAKARPAAGKDAGAPRAFAIPGGRLSQSQARCRQGCRRSGPPSLAASPPKASPALCHPWRQAAPKPGPLPSQALPSLADQAAPSGTAAIPGGRLSQSQARCRQGCRRSQGFCYPWRQRVGRRTPRRDSVSPGICLCATAAR